MSERDKAVFKAKLKGDLIGQDALGRDVYIGDFVTYAVTSYRSGALRFGKVTALKGDGESAILVVRLVSRDWRTGCYEIGNIGRAMKVRNILRLDDPLNS